MDVLDRGDCEELRSSATAKSPRRDNESQPDHEQNGTEPGVAAVTAHRRSVDDVHALTR